MSSTIWLLDRSRVVDGRGFCKRARFNNYHLGPHGYGIAMKASKLPLMTGIAGHDGLAPILEWCRDHDDLIQQGLATGIQGDEVYLPVPREVVRAAVAGAQAKYWKAVEVRGFAYLRDDEAVQAVTREQCYLIEGLIWAWCLEVLPEVLRRGRIVEVEHDDTYVFGCTCGLGDGVGSQHDHEERDCQGLGLMCKPDFVLETRLTKELEYNEFKTTSMDSVTFRDKWEVAVQTFSATLDVERRWGKHVQSVYIHGLVKGKREGDYNSDTGKRDGTIRQNSPFVYGYRKPGTPPMEREEWAASYEYYDPIEGKNRKLGKAYRKVGVWELPDAIVPEGMTKGEFWATWMPSEARKKALVVLGPFSRQTQMVQHFLAECVGEEAGVQAGLWELYDAGAQILLDQKAEQSGDENADWWRLVWPDPRFQTLLDKLFPRSYECRRYGMRHRCQFEEVCFEKEGWQDPLGTGKFVLRRPHHRMELEQAVARGCLVPDAAEAEDAEEEPGW